MSISIDNIITINLNELADVRANFLGLKLTDDQIDEVASELRIRMTFDSLFQQTDHMVYEVVDEYDPNLPHYGEIAPEPGREAWLNEIEKNKKQFEMVDLVSPSWTIQVPRRKNVKH